MEFFYFRSRRAASSRSTPPATSTSPRTTSAPSSASRRCCGSRRWASPWSTRSTRTARASTRSTCGYTDTLTHGRQRDDVPSRHQGGRAGSRRVRDVHAEADRRRVRLGDALAPLAVRRRRQRVPRSRRRVRPVEGREALHRRTARALERDRRDHEPVGQLVQAADPRIRGAGLQVLGAQQPFGARARPAPEEGQERLDTHRVPRPRSRRATRTSRSR